jgi:UDP-2,3-diacylglucosamine pyrophosphatase LpxH
VVAAAHAGQPPESAGASAAAVAWRSACPLQHGRSQAPQQTAGTAWATTAAQAATIHPSLLRRCTTVCLLTRHSTPGSQIPVRQAGRSLIENSPFPVLRPADALISIDGDGHTRHGAVLRVRTLFISDVHLGCGFSRAQDLFDFLGRIEPERLYLVGDIIDGWKLKRNFVWTDTSSFVVRRVLGMLKRGTRVRYVTGNHDEFLRGFSPHVFGHMELADEFVHVTADGRRLLVIHGDCFDHLTRHAPWLYHLGDRAYTFALHANAWVNAARRLLGYPYWSLSATLKGRVKQAVNFVNDFERFVARHTQRAGCSGVVCGHIHVPAIRRIDGIDYHNCGDWIEHCSALVEHFDGRIELVGRDSFPPRPQAEEPVNLPEYAACA